MDPVAVFLLSAAGILLVGALGELVFRTTGFPDVIWLMLAGAILGPWLGIAGPAVLDPAAPYFASLALAVVVFETGSRFRVAELLGPHRRAAALGVVAFVSSVLAVAAVAMLAVSLRWLPGAPGAPWDWRRCLLLGAILGGTSSTIFLPALIRARADLHAASIASLESATGETLAIVAACALAVPGPVRSFGSALAIGIVAGLVWLLFLKTIRATNHAYSITLALLLVLSVGVENWGGVPAMAILGAAVVLGNAPSIARALKLSDVLDLGEDVRGYRSQLAFLIKAFFFVFLGTRLGPPWGPVAIGAALAVALLAARIPAVALVAGTRLESRRGVLNACLPRGLVAGVLGALAWSRWVPGDAALPGLVAGCVFASVALFAVLLPAASAGYSPAAGGGGAPGTYAPAAPVPPVAPPVRAEDLWALPPAAPLIWPRPARPAVRPSARGVPAPVPPDEIIAVPPSEPDITPGSGFRW